MAYRNQPIKDATGRPILGPDGRPLILTGSLIVTMTAGADLCDTLMADLLGTFPIFQNPGYSSWSEKAPVALACVWEFGDPSVHENLHWNIGLCVDGSWAVQMGSHDPPVLTGMSTEHCALVGVGTATAMFDTSGPDCLYDAGNRTFQFEACSS